MSESVSESVCVSTTNCLIIDRRAGYEQKLWLKEPKKERKNCKKRALTSALGRTRSDAYGGRGGGGPKRRPHSTPLGEAVSGALSVLPALVLMQPLTEDLDHRVFLQDLSVQSSDPSRRTSRERRGTLT